MRRYSEFVANQITETLQYWRTSRKRQNRHEIDPRFHEDKNRFKEQTEYEVFEPFRTFEFWTVSDLEFWYSNFPLIFLLKTSKFFLEDTKTLLGTYGKYCPIHKEKISKVYIATFLKIYFQRNIFISILINK